MNKSYLCCPGGGKYVEFNVLFLFLSVCLLTAPLTDKPPKILSPPEGQMSVIEMAIGKEACFIPPADGLFSVR